MNVQTEEPETIWHLEMLHPEELCAKALPPKTQLIRQEIPLPTMNRFFIMKWACCGIGQIGFRGVKNNGETGWNVKRSRPGCCFFTARLPVILNWRPRIKQ